METKSEIKPPNITYWFGAGASANAIPIVSNINDTMKKLLSFIDKHVKNAHESKIYSGVGTYHCNDHEYTQFLNFITKWIEKIRQAPSIDTYAKRLFDNGKLNEYKEYKVFLTIAFHYFHYKNYFVDSEKKGEWTYYGPQLEGRYENFFRSINYPTSQGDFTTNIPSNFCFLSWNYDCQFEFNRLLDSRYKSDYWNGLLNFEKEMKERFIQLNGSSILNNRLSGYYDNFEITTESELFKLLLLIHVFSLNNEKEITSFRFSWENKVDLKQLVEIAKKTEILVIIGYSFPSFNRKIDSIFYDIVRDNNCTVYTQGYDMNDSKRIENYFKQCFSPDKSVVNVYPVESPFFFIPPQFYGVERDEADVW